MNFPAAPLHSTTLALLVLDTTGTVRAANEVAGQLWQTPAADLAGQPLVSLFASNATNDSPGWRKSQWEALIATALGRPLRMLAQPFEPVAAVAVRVELQTAHGPDSVYFATIEAEPLLANKPEALPTVVSAAALTDLGSVPASAGPELLAALGPLGFFDLDLQTGRLVSSPAWKRMLGYASNELPDTHEAWRTLIHPDDTAALPDQVAKPPLTDHRAFTSECRLRHRLGHYLWVQSSGIQLFGPDRALIRVIGLNADIQERKEVEEIALAGEDRLARLTDASGLALFDLDFTTGVHWFAPACATLLHTDQASPTIESLERAIANLTTESGLEAFLNHFATGQPYASCAIRLRLAGGQETPAVLGLHRQWSRKRTVNRVIGYIQPLPAGTGTLPAAILDTLLTTLNEAVIVTDARAQVIYLNAKATQLTGWTRADVHAVKLNDVFKLVNADTGRPDETALDFMLGSGGPPRVHGEHALVAASGGQPRRINWSPRLIESPAGGIEGVVVVFRDPQEMHLTAEERPTGNRLESLIPLVGCILPDLNPLLTTNLGGFSTAKDRRDDTTLGEAERAGLAANALTSQLSPAARSRASADQIAVTPREILTDAVRLATAGTTARVLVDAAENISPIQVDRGRITQVVQNLVINALQAMPDLTKGRVQLRARDICLDAHAVPPLGAGDYVQIEVQDNGCGIPAAQIDKIFDPFYSTKNPGMGLDLATVRTIMLEHGGQITVASTGGAGTTITLHFPRTARPASVMARSTPTLRFGTGRILVLDDDPKIGELTGGMLASLEYTYDVVRTGEDAITFYRRYLNVGRPYDVVLLDLNIVGGMGGEACFEQLRALHPEVRAIVNSGYDSEALAQRFKDKGLAGYLTKPYRVSDLGRIIKVALGKA